jgi:hypothetical protein
MQSPRAIRIQQKIDLLTDDLKKYLHPIFDEWKRIVPKQIQEGIANPLFTLHSDKTISINFKKEVKFLFIIRHNE